MHIVQELLSHADLETSTYCRQGFRLASKLDV